MFKRKDPPAPAGATDEAASVQAARTRARRRLIGAAVLVGIGIIGFPLLFETQPRPIAVDIPIEIPSRDQALPLKLPTPKASGPVAARPAEPAPAPVAAASAAAPAPAPTPAPAQAAVAEPVPALPATSTPAEREFIETPLPARAAASAAQRDAQRAQSILEGKPVAAATATASASASASAPKTARYVVQAGAYTDSAALREARQKVEKLGLKTYTQVIESDAGSRTRVRVGPFDSREEADKAAARIKSAGLAANVLTL